MASGTKPMNKSSEGNFVDTLTITVQLERRKVITSVMILKMNFIQKLSRDSKVKLFNLTTCFVRLENWRLFYVI